MAVTPTEFNRAALSRAFCATSAISWLSISATRRANSRSASLRMAKSTGGGSSSDANGTSSIPSPRAVRNALFVERLRACAAGFENEKVCTGVKCAKFHITTVLSADEVRK